MNTEPYASIDEYIEKSPIECRLGLKALCDVIRKAAPQATERFAYGMPTFYLEGNLVHFMAAKKHIGFYPTPSGVERFVALKPGFQSSKGAVQFPIGEPLPLDAVDEVVRFRVKENLAKAAEKDAARKAKKA